MSNRTETLALLKKDENFLKLKGLSYMYTDFRGQNWGLPEDSRCILAFDNKSCDWFFNYTDSVFNIRVGSLERNFSSMLSQIQKKETRRANNYIECAKEVIKHIRKLEMIKNHEY